MKIKVVFAAFMLFFLPAAASLAKTSDADTEDTRVYKFIEGVISSYDGLNMLVNEGIRVNVPLDAKVFDSRGAETVRQEIREKKWVYIEGPVNHGSIEAEKIYILPRYIGKKEKSKYPYIQIP